jgi:hypothetical protein
MTKSGLCSAFVMLFVASYLLIARPCAAQQQYVDGPPGNQETWEGVKLHACPVGFAMAGANVKDNKFTCQRMVPASDEAQVQSVLDGGTQKDLGRGKMHVCPEGTYMRGLRSDQNKLLCSGSPSVKLQSPFVDAAGNTQGNDMHMCPERLKQQTVMTGIHTGKNNFACAFP